MWSRIDSLRQDTRYALRGLRASPGFAAVAVLTLGLGIGATTAIFSLLDAVLLKPLPVNKPRELVLVRGGGQYPAFVAFRAHREIFVDLCASSGVTRLEAEIQQGAREPVDVSLVSGSYFSTLGVPAASGRMFTVADDREPGEHPVAVISDAFWRRRFGADPAIVNRVVRVTGTPITIVGVAPPGFFGEEVGASPDLWIPLTMWPQVVSGRNLLESPGTAWLRVIGRVRPGVPTSGVQPALSATFRGVLNDIFGTRAQDDVRREIARATVRFEPAGHGAAGVGARFAQPLQLLMGAVVLLLLIACSNIANLLLARATARHREIGVRLALGATRTRIVRQLLTESVILAVAGSGLGVALASVAREALLRMIATDGSRLSLAVSTDLRLLGFVGVVAAATTILFGLLPASRTARAASTMSVLARIDARVAGGGRLGWFLIAGQVAVSLVLLTGAGLFVRTLANLRAVDLGFMPERLIVLDVNPAATGRTLLDALDDVPGVSSISLAENGVLMGRDNTTDRLQPAGFVAGPEGLPRVHWDIVGPQYFATLGTPLLAGRDFSRDDDVGAPLVAAINEEMARRFFAGATAIGQRLHWGIGDGVELEVAAVTRDVKQVGPRSDPEMRFYVPYLQMPRIRPDWDMASSRLLVRTTADPALIVPPLRAALAATDARLAIASVEVGPDLVRRSVARERMVTGLLVVFAVIATVLASLGLYGSILYHVAQRTTEMGIRMALGARRGQVLWAVMKGSLTCVAAGVIAGVPLASSGSRLAQGLLFGLSGTDAATLFGATAAIASTALLAAYLPARRATRVDPSVALRAE